MRSRREYDVGSCAAVTRRQPGKATSGAAGGGQSWTDACGGRTARPGRTSLASASCAVSRTRAVAAPPSASAVVAGRYALLDQVGSRRHGLGVAGARRAHRGATSRSRCWASTAPACWPASCASRRSGCGTRTWWRRTGWAAEDDLVVLAMDLVAGGSVADLLREHGPLDAGYGRPAARAAAAWAWRRSTAPGWCTATSSRPTCCSRRPATATRTCGSGDFGVAAPVADRRFTTVPGAIGTDGYMAPEQARGAPPEPTPGPLRRRAGSALRARHRAAAGTPARGAVPPAAPPARAAPRRRPRAAARLRRGRPAPAAPAPGAAARPARPSPTASVPPPGRRRGPGRPGSPASTGPGGAPSRPCSPSSRVV